MPAVPPCFPHEAGPLRSAITLPPSVTVGDPRLRAVRPGLLAGGAGVRPEAREGYSRPPAAPPHTNRGSLSAGPGRYSSPSLPLSASETAPRERVKHTAARMA